MHGSSHLYAIKTQWKARNAPQSLQCCHRVRRQCCPGGLRGCRAGRFWWGVRPRQPAQWREDRNHPGSHLPPHRHPLLHSVSETCQVTAFSHRDNCLKSSGTNTEMGGGMVWINETVRYKTIPTLGIPKFKKPPGVWLFLPVWEIFMFQVHYTQMWEKFISKKTRKCRHQLY